MPRETNSQGPEGLEVFVAQSFLLEPTALTCAAGFKSDYCTIRTHASGHWFEFARFPKPATGGWIKQLRPFIGCVLGEHKPWCLLDSWINDRSLLWRGALPRKADSSSTHGTEPLIQSSCCRHASLSSCSIVYVRRQTLSKR